MNKEDNEDFNNITKCWICDNDYTDTDVKVRYHCHVTWKHRGAEHGDCNINLKLNKQILMIFRNLKYYDSQLIM